MTRGRRRRSLLPLPTVGLVVHLGVAAANPWGITLPPEGQRERVPGPAWNQGADIPAQAPSYPAPAPDDRYSAGVGAPAGTRAEAPVDADAPALDAAGYRFRGDAPGAMAPAPGGVGGGPDTGAYRFRPLTEREQGRQGRGGGTRPAQPSPGPWPQDAGPTWGPGAPAGVPAGRWPSR